MNPSTDRTWSELFDHLLWDSKQLIKTEVELLKENAREGVRRQTRTLRTLAVGFGFLGLGGLWFLLSLTHWVQSFFETSSAFGFFVVGLGLTIPGSMFVLKSLNALKKKKGNENGVHE